MDGEAAFDFVFEVTQVSVETLSPFQMRIFGQIHQGRRARKGHLGCRQKRGSIFHRTTALNGPSCGHATRGPRHRRWRQKKHVPSLVFWRFLEVSGSESESWMVMG